MIATGKANPSEVERRVLARLARWLSSPVSVSWRGQSVGRDGSPHVKGLQVLALDVEWFCLRFDRVYPVPSVWFVRERVVHALASVRIDGEEKARRGAPRTVLKWLVSLLDNPPTIDVTVAFARLLREEGLLSDCWSAEVECARVALAARLGDANFLLDRLLIDLLGPELAKAVRGLWRHGTAGQTRTLLVQALRHPDAFVATWSGVEVRGWQSLLPLLTFNSADPEAELLAFFGRGGAGDLLRQLPGEAIEVIHALADGDPLRCSDFIDEVVARIEPDPQRWAEADPAKVAVLAVACQRRTALELARSSGSRYLAPGDLPLFGLTNRQPVCLTAAVQGVPIEYVEVLFTRLLDDLCAAPADTGNFFVGAESVERLDELLHALSTMSRKTALPPIEHLLQSSLDELAHLAASWRVTNELARCSRPWPAGLPLDGLAVPATDLVWQALDSESSLLIAGTHFGNCLASPGQRTQYANRCRAGRERIFLLSQRTHPIAIIRLNWLATEQRWDLSESEGVQRKALAAAVKHEIRAFTETYSALMPRPFEVQEEE